MKFVAIDVETANQDVASICQIGVVTFEQGHILESWETLVNPEDYFDSFNIAVHGITEESVRDAPIFPAVFEALHFRLAKQIVVSHTPFDKTAIARVSEKYGLPVIGCSWLDSARVVRRTWPRFARRGYGLKNIAQWLGIKFDHHNAVEDARAAGQVVVHAVKETGVEIADLLKTGEKPIRSSAAKTIAGTFEVT